MSAAVDKNFKVVLKKPKPKDVAQMQNLVAPEVASGIILPRSDDEVSTNIRSYVIACLQAQSEPKFSQNSSDDDKELKIIGFCALHIHTPKLAEVRSLIVGKEARGRGVGSMMVEKLLEEARFYGLESVFTLTYQRAFFERLGFYEIPKTQLPEQKIWADCIKCKSFPVCNEIALIYNL